MPSVAPSVIVFISSVFSGNAAGDNGGGVITQGGAMTVVNSTFTENEAVNHGGALYGTGGTLKGVARVLKAKSPQTKIVVCEPDNAQVLGSGIPNPRNPDGTSASHPMSRPHPMQGWSPDFIPKLTEDAVAMKLIDRILPVNGADAMRCARDLARQEGILVGITGGATFAGALEICKSAAPGSNVLCMLPDTGERYLSTVLFEGINEGGDPEP